MWPDRVSNPGPLTYESGAQPTALRARHLYRHLIQSHIARTFSLSPSLSLVIASIRGMSRFIQYMSLPVHYTAKN